ncbi:hypothetical protein Pla163_29860 [Planctomycetes bacterium Pla163]|uniref:Uncharacterized protein n=1 Tax=Rohdeia mirabilis TaxID=2528008 RepID=A0A518D318_9BACT|nr:hypothetical protein Pla163_29860 [Planctomycetes bacterium Pla163]
MLRRIRVRKLEHESRGRPTRHVVGSNKNQTSRDGWRGASHVGAPLFRGHATAHPGRRSEPYPRLVGHGSSASRATFRQTGVAPSWQRHPSPDSFRRGASESSVKTAERLRPQSGPSARRSCGTLDLRERRSEALDTAPRFRMVGRQVERTVTATVGRQVIGRSDARSPAWSSVGRSVDAQHRSASNANATVECPPTPDRVADAQPPQRCTLVPRNGSPNSVHAQIVPIFPEATHRCSWLPTHFRQGPREVVLGPDARCGNPSHASTERQRRRRSG